MVTWHKSEAVAWCQNAAKQHSGSVAAAAGCAVVAETELAAGVAVVSCVASIVGVVAAVAVVSRLQSLRVSADRATAAITRLLNLTL